jgi:hypothetical protein
MKQMETVLIDPPTCMPFFHAALEILVNKDRDLINWNSSVIFIRQEGRPLG